MIPGRLRFRVLRLGFLEGSILLSKRRRCHEAIPRLGEVCPSMPDPQLRRVPVGALPSVLGSVEGSRSHRGGKMGPRPRSVEREMIRRRPELRLDTTGCTGSCQGRWFSPESFSP